MRQLIGSSAYFTYGLAAGLTSPLISLAISREFSSIFYGPIVLPGAFENPSTKAGACTGVAVLIGLTCFAASASTLTAACAGSAVATAAWNLK